MNALIIRNKYNQQVMEASILLTAYLASQSIAYDLVEVSDLNSAATHERIAMTNGEDGEGIDLAIVLGGDGTILHAAKLLRGMSTPILGINFGRLGFLANNSEDGVVPMVSRALAGGLACERRTNLHIDVVCEGEDDPFADAEDAGAEDLAEGAFGPEGESGDADVADAGDADGIATADADDASDLQESVAPAENVMPHPHVVDFETPMLGIDLDGLNGQRSFFALNEIAVTRGSLGRIIDFSLDVSGSHIADMRGDGLVVATATGSTAYALSAGGPLVAPGFGGLITVPLSPHTLYARSLLTGENDVVRMGLTSVEVHREATLFVDGDLLVFDKPVRCVYVRRGKTPTMLLRTQGEGFYDHAAQTFFARD